MLADSRSLATRDLRCSHCSVERVSACAMSGMILVNWERRRRYSMSTALMPVSVNKAQMFFREELTFIYNIEDSIDLRPSTTT